MKSSILAFCVGAGLLALGGAHFLNERQVLSQDEGLPGFGHIIGTPLPDVDRSQFVRASGELVLPYVQRVNSLIHTSTYHCDAPEFSLSWIEIGLAKLSGDRQYGWEDGLFGNDLLCGLCSQRAITLALILNENGVQDAIAYGMSGHVVVKFKDDTGQELLVDPDYGVEPFRMLTNSDAFKMLVRDKYRETPFGNRENLVRIITSLDDNEENRSADWSRDTLTAREALFRTADIVAGIAAAIGAASLLLSASLLFRRKRGPSLSAPRTAYAMATAKFAKAIDQ